MRYLLTLAVSLLLAAVAPASTGRPAEVAPPPARRPRHAAPPARQARPVPRIPDYPAFAATAEAHSALWEIVYDHSTATPYTARNRVTGHTVAVDDLDLLDHVLTGYEPPHPVRGYLDRARVRPYVTA